MGCNINTLFPLFNATLYLKPLFNKRRINKVRKWYKRFCLINAASITDSDAEDARQPFHLLGIDEEADDMEVLLTVTMKYDLFFILFWVLSNM